MNNFGNFLYNLRKQRGWTQTELADKLGVTNQAVSKWENSDSFPDTGMLVPLAELFGVSVDELLKGKRKPMPATEQKTFERDSATIAAEEKNDNAESSPVQSPLVNETEEKSKTGTDGNAESAKNDETTDSPPHHRKQAALFNGAIMLSATIAFFLLGALGNYWYVCWLAFPVGITLCALLNGIDEYMTKKKTAEFCGFIMLACADVFLFLGLQYSLWHPAWIVFLIGPLFCALFGAIDNIRKENNR